MVRNTTIFVTLCTIYFNNKYSHNIFAKKNLQTKFKININGKNQNNIF